MASVWYKEVYEGLKTEIQTSVYYVDETVPSYKVLDDKQVTVRKPEEDLKFEKYPCVSLYITETNRDLIRYDPNLVPVRTNSNNHMIVMEEPHQPYTLTCQIDFWAKYQEDMEEMIKTWLEKHFRQFNLEVSDDNSKKTTCNCLQKGDIVKSDLVNGKERLFHSIIILEIWVELDFETRYNKPMVDSVAINVATE